MNLEKVKDFDLFRNRLMAHEGEAAIAYWDMIRRLLKDDVHFEKRVRQGAKDIVNSCLNYGYGILYPRLWQAVIETGLNPSISFLHKPQHNEPTLTFDLIEEFRQQVVDRTVFSLFTKGKELRLADGLLSTSTRNTVLNAVLTRLNTPTRFRGKKLTFEEIMFHQTKALAEFLLDKRNTYNPFVGTYS
jgi:CRISPR-associated protein Cas1